MLLRHTTEKEIERKALTVNPAKTCQPIGAMYASLGIHGCLPHSHGSQGCCAYHRSALTKHYKEPVMASTSSFTEGASVFGGQANLIQAINTIFAVYEPDIVAVHSTCLSETIGDDLKQIVGKAEADGRIPEGKHVIQASTPSYVGSHVTGYHNMLEAIVKYFAIKTDEAKKQVNLLSGWVDPADMRELKRIANVMGVKTVLVPDTSDVLDTPLTGKFEMYPKGGTTIPELVSMGDSMKTVALGEWATKGAAVALDNQCKVPFDMCNLPIGLKATDRFIMALSKAGAVSVPEEINRERGRLMDLITDMHQYFYGKRVALFGDPDHLLPMVEFLLDLDMIPCYVVSGTPGKAFTAHMNELYGDKIEMVKFKNGPQADTFQLHQWIKQEGVDLIIGNTYGKYIAKDENTPLLRMGFPILDRIGQQYFTILGYQGAIRLCEKMLDLFMQKLDDEAPVEKFELTL